MLGLLLLLAEGLWAPHAGHAQTAPEEARAPAFGQLFDAVVARTSKDFWDKDRLLATGWKKLAEDARPAVAEAASLEEAARLINVLLAKLETSHTAFLTPDEVDYYILLSVLGRADMPQDEYHARFWGSGATYAGIGHFSIRVDGRDYVDALLEGSPAQRAGLKVGDEVLAVDGAPHHLIRSFRGKVGQAVTLTIRRARDGPSESVKVPVVSIAPLHAFSEATRASARVIEHDGRRIGYVHVWASFSESVRALSDALGKLRFSPAPLDGLIVDMRGKIGGNIAIPGQYLDMIAPRGPRWRWRRSGMRDSLAAALRGRTAVLIDHHTRSAAELFAHAYKSEKVGPLIGSKTAGAVSAGGVFAMPGGNLLYLAVQGLELIDGEVLEGAGVAPDIEVARPLPYANGADPVLDAAVGFLAQKVAPKAAPAPATKSGTW